MNADTILRELMSLARTAGDLDRRACIGKASGGEVGRAYVELEEALRAALADKQDAPPAAQPLPEGEGTERIWTCKIGGRVLDLQHGADSPMRNAIYDAFVRVTGYAPEFTFSGWGGSLTEGERAVVENRLPAPPAAQPQVGRDALVDELVGEIAAYGQHAGETKELAPTTRMVELLSKLRAALAAQVEPSPAAPPAAQPEREALQAIMRATDAAKEPCGPDPESPAAIRNGAFASIAQMAAQGLGLVRGPTFAAQVEPAPADPERDLAARLNSVRVEPAPAQPEPT